MQYTYPYAGYLIESDERTAEDTLSLVECLITWAYSRMEDQQCAKLDLCVEPEAC